MLAARHLKRLAETRLWCLCRLPPSACPLQKQFAFAAMELRLPPALAGALYMAARRGTRPAVVAVAAAVSLTLLAASALLETYA